MGTRSITVITDQVISVVLYKHWDGYPDAMLSYFKNARCFMERYEDGYLPHFMEYPEDVAAAIIVSAWKGPRGKEARLRPPDFRPVFGFNSPISNEIITELGRKHDAEYVYVIDLREGAKAWQVNVFELNNGEYKYTGSAQISCK